jgi:ubiquitin carboxyl-terminal hydrolase 14
VLDIVTDDLKEKLGPVSRRLKEIEKERAERRKVRKRTKVATTAGSSKDADVEMADASAASTASGSTATGEGKGKEVAAGELDDESVYREKETKELEELVSPELKNDVGCSVTGLYDLVGESHVLRTPK